CWREDMGLLLPQRYKSLQCLLVCLFQENASGVHVQNVQLSYIGIHMPWWFAAPINLSHPRHSNFSSV
uniref:Uncharacterized protein n=1 Tax=Macaca fascicularis TaxID=9541 RepID=A0A7N9CTP9_MACFA